MQRGRAREASGDVAGGKVDFGQAAELGRALGDPALLARAALGWAGPYTTGAMNPDIVRLLEDALALLPDNDNSDRAEVLCRLSFELYWGGDHARMQTLARQGIEMARRLDDPRVLGSGLNVAALLYDDISQAEERLALMQEAIRMADAARDGGVAHMARSFASWAQLELGDRAGYDRTVAEGTLKAREMRLPRMRWYVPLWETVIALISGDIVEAERLALETLALGQAADDFASLQIFGAQMFSIRREQGRLDEFDSLVRNMVEDFPAVPAWRAALTLLLAELGNSEEAGAYLDIVGEDQLSSIPRDNAWAAGVTLVGDAAFLLEAPEHSATVFTLLLPHAERFVAVGQAECFGSVHRMLGQAASVCSRFDDAIDHFERGIAADLGMGGMRMAIRGRWGLARTLLVRHAPGDRERARGLIDESLVSADRLGLVKLAERLRALEA